MTATHVHFTGFGTGAVDFFADLEAHNDRDWWQANRERHAREVGDPMAALAAELEGRYGPVKVFRPYRDVRFSADKRPLKEQAALAAAPLGPALYLQLSADGLMLAGGWWQPERAVLDAFRRLVDRPAGAAGLRRHLTGLAADGFDLAAPELVRAPRGYRSDHREIDLLRVTRLAVTSHHPPGPWLAGPEALERITAGWAVAQRWNRWLVDHLPAASQPAV